MRLASAKVEGSQSEDSSDGVLSRPRSVASKDRASQLDRWTIHVLGDWTRGGRVGRLGL